MTGYDDPDEYMDEYEEDNEDLEEGDEYEEEEAPQPTQEELDYLQLRQRLKESIRNRSKKESGSNSANKKPKLSNNNFGSFFGPSQPVIAKRVIEESKALLATRPTSLNKPNSLHSNGSSNHPAAPNVSTLNSGTQVEIKKKSKAQIVRASRDYSFLFSDDAELPVSKEVSSASNSGMKSSQAPSKSQHTTCISQGKKPILNDQRGSKAPLSKPPVGKPGVARIDSKRELGGNNSMREKPTLKYLPSKGSGINSEKKVIQNMKNSVPAPIKNGVSRPQGSTMHEKIQQKKALQQSTNGRVLPKQPVTLKHAVPRTQMNKPEKDIKRKAVRQYSDDDDEDEDTQAMSMLRKMLRYNPSKYAAMEEEDDESDMEANFDDIMQEEARSAHIARMEDAEELKKIEEEERRERMRKMEKKRRIAHL